MVSKLKCLFGFMCNSRDILENNFVNHSLDVVQDEALKQISSTLPSFDIKGKGYQRIGIIPDIHGDLEGLIGSLFLVYHQAGGVSYNSESFSDLMEAYLDDTHSQGSLPTLTTPNSVLLVQLGDLVDRGPSTEACIALILKVERIFRNWKLIGLYGNHEFMNYYRKYIYVNPDDPLQGEARDKFFSTEGDLWPALAEKYGIIARVSSSINFLFVHGGLHLEWFTKLPDGLLKNRDEKSLIDAANALAFYIATQNVSPTLDSMNNNPQSPLWTRIFEKTKEHALCNEILPPLLKAFKVHVIIVGHNPQGTRRVRVRCDNQIILADSIVSGDMYKPREPSNPTGLVATLTNDGTVTSLYAHYQHDYDVIWRDPL